MRVYYTKCRRCGDSVRVSAKFCFHCGHQARPVPVVWFSFLSALYVTYTILDNYNFV